MSCFPRSLRNEAWRARAAWKMEAWRQRAEQLPIQDPTYQRILGLASRCGPAPGREGSGRICRLRPRRYRWPPEGLAADSPTALDKGRRSPRRLFRAVVARMLGRGPLASTKVSAGVKRPLGFSPTVLRSGRAQWSGPTSCRLCSPCSSKKTISSRPAPRRSADRSPSRARSDPA